MKCSLGISNFLEEISSASYCIVFLYFFALFTLESFLLSSCYSLELCIQLDIYLSFPLCLSLLSFSQIFVRPPQRAICLDEFLFCHHLLYDITNFGPLFFRHFVYQIRSLESICNFYCIIVKIWFRSCLNDLVFFHTFLSLTLNFAISSSWSEAQSASGLVFAVTGR